MTPTEYHLKLEEKWTEHKHQVMLCRQLDSLGITYFAIPNGSNKSMTARNKFKAEGLKKGVPDIQVLLPDITLFIELKKLKNSYPNKEQKEWITKLNKLKYASARCCKGWREAMEFVSEHLPKKKENPMQKHLEDYL